MSTNSRTYKKIDNYCIIFQQKFGERKPKAEHIFKEGDTERTAHKSDEEGHLYDFSSLRSSPRSGH